MSFVASKGTMVSSDSWPDLSGGAGGTEWNWDRARAGLASPLPL
jgi:hypothetical protein